MIYEVTVHIIGEHKTGVNEWVYPISAASPALAKQTAMRIAQDTANEKFSRYKNCKFEVDIDKDIVPITKK